MSDFDHQLRLRLQRLEAAVPEPRQPSRPALRVLPSRRHTAVVALAAMMALIVGSAIVALASAPPRNPAQDAANESRLRDDLDQHWGACMTEPQARALVQSRLSALGLDGWVIRLDRTSLAQAPCVGAAVFGDTSEVLLAPSLGTQINNAKETVAADLLSSCLDRTQATELLRTTLEAAGLNDPTIVVGGIRAVPAQASAYLEHVANGCVVFSDTQADDQGYYTWWLTSK
jgi:hypothetical protein